MKIRFNQRDEEVVKDITIEALLVGKGLTLAGVAVALNQRVVATTLWTKTQLSDGDEIDVFSVVAGG